MYRNQINRLRKTFSEAYDNDDVIKAILTGERILKLYNTNKGSDTLFFSDDAYNLACAYSKEGRFSKAAALFKKSADIVEKIHGKNLDYSRIITNLAVELGYMGKIDEAIDYFKDVCKIRENIIPEGHTEYIDSLSNLGSAFYNAEDYENALKYHKKALSLRVRKDLDYIDNLNMIGYDYEGKNDLENACEYFISALDLLKKVKGGRSDEYLKNAYYLAFIYEKAKNYMEAKNYYEQSVELIKVFAGETHPYYAEALNKLANTLLHLGNQNKALTLRIKALNIIKNIVGENHLYYASSLKNIADIYFQKNDFTRAKKMYRESIEIKKKILGENSEEYIRDSAMLAKTYINTSDYETAESILCSLSEKSKKNKDLYISILIDLAFIYVKMSDTTKLYSIYKEFERTEPGLSFDEMLDNIREFAASMNISAEELEKAYSSSKETNEVIKENADDNCNGEENKNLFSGMNNYGEMENMSLFSDMDNYGKAGDMKLSDDIDVQEE